MTGSDDIPIAETYRGVGLHDQQSPQRLDVVRAAIDQVFEITDTRELLRIAASPRYPPEARLLAAALLEAMMQIAADERKVRPDIDLDKVHAAVAGVNSIKWRDPRHYGSLLDVPSSPGEHGPVVREKPLASE